MKYPFLDLAKVNAPYADELLQACRRIITSGRYIGGEELELFECKLAHLSQTAHAVGVSNGLDALRLIFRAYITLGHLRPGDEVIVPSNTYIASILAVTDSGLCPVFAEPRIDTLNIDTTLIEKHITPRTRAILTVHLYGRPAYDNIMESTARRHNLLIIEDNAQACGAKIGDRPTGSLGHAAAWSFYPTKNVGALGDGGAITTCDDRLASTVRSLANYGSTRRYINDYVGLNCRLDPIQAAMLCIKLHHLDEENRKRRSLAEIYSSLIANPLVTPPPIDSNYHVYHQYVVLSPLRDSLRQYLNDHEVETDIHYPAPPHRQPCYARAFGHLNLPLADKIASECLSLPINPACTSIDDAKAIAGIINKFSHA